MDEVDAAAQTAVEVGKQSLSASLCVCVCACACVRACVCVCVCVCVFLGGGQVEDVKKQATLFGVQRPIRRGWWYGGVGGAGRLTFP